MFCGAVVLSYKSSALELGLTEVTVNTTEWTATCTHPHMHMLMHIRGYLGTPALSSPW